MISRLCVLAISNNLSISGGLPNTGDTNIALVFGVTFFTNSFRSKLRVWYSISTNTGYNPFCMIGFNVVGNPTTDIKISSVDVHLKYCFSAAIITRLAELPEFTITEYF